MEVNWRLSCARIGFGTFGRRLYFRIPGEATIYRAPLGGNQALTVAWFFQTVDQPFPIPEFGSDLFVTYGQVKERLLSGDYELPSIGAIPW